VVREHQQQIAKLDAALRQPRLPRPDIAKLRAALEHRLYAEWGSALKLPDGIGTDVSLGGG
jgi:hypothetical protein